MNRQFYFPRVIETRPVSQVNKAREEFGEFLEALVEKGPDDQAEEYWDHVHALEQLGRDMAQAMGDRFWNMREYVQAKNARKGLYGALD